MDDGLAFLQPQFLQHRVHALGAEDAHQIVFEGQIEQRAAGIALAPGAAAQLVVNAAAFMALGADDEQPAGSDNLLPVGFDLGLDGLDTLLALGPLRHVGQFGGDPHVEIAAQFDVGAAARHVGGDGDAAGDARLGDDRRFLLVVARVQHRMGNVLGLQQLGQDFGFLDRSGADENRLALDPRFVDGFDDRRVFLARGAEHLVVLVGAGDSHVGRNVEDVELVDVHEFFRFGLRRAGHAGELAV